MKIVGINIINMLLGSVTLLIVMSVYGRMNYSMELKSNLSSVIEETVENIMLNSKYNIENTNEFLADFVEMLSMRIDTESDITVEIFQCDKEKGILSLNVIASYQYPNGKMGNVMCERTVILNKLKKDTVRICKVEFWVKEELYKEYLVQEKSIIINPQNLPGIEGVFYGWVDENGNHIDFTQPIIEDVVCYANIQ